MLGYNASAPDERSRKQVAIMDLVRHHLRLPEKPSSRRPATRTNHNKQHNTDPPIDHFNNTTVGVVPSDRETTNDEEGSVSDAKEQQDPTAHQTERILTASDIYKARRAETLCTLQATGRAAALLTAAEAEPVVFSPELVQSLDDLYPQEDTRTYPEPAVSAPLVTFDSKDVAKMIESRLTRGAAPGLDGWTRELLYPLTKDKALLMEITAILTDMANGNVAPEVAHRLRATNLTVLRKPNKKFRPIGAECVWAKAISLMRWTRSCQPSKPALRTCNTGSATTSSWRLRRYGRTSASRAVWPCWTAGMRTTPSVARPSYPPSMATHMEPTVAGHTTPAGHGRAGGASTKMDNWSTRGRRRGECDRAWCWDPGFFPSAPSPPSPTGKQLPQRQLHGVPGRRYGGGTTGHAWAGMRGDIQSDACPGHRDERGQDGGPPYRRPVDMPAEYIRPFARVLGAGIANDPESELITRFVQRKARRQTACSEQLWSSHLRNTRSGGSCPCRRCHA
ncbi:putative SLACS reverse transcriptase [Trypanosoma cruzi]|uniref:Putative SLACS reverse transcriptase n=1 Tax=Trypanosoma cruzi TaxID=5693 RepID=A0A2V2UZ88_TRYCR|nr:putative SLACS reverse transcriptase [Trypanosoma cruzi]